MKAWFVREKGEYCATIVFAETRGKAKSMALTTDCCGDANFCDIEVRRVPQADKYYKDGKTEMDWFDPNDRIALVRDCDFSCEYAEIGKSESCAAKDYCNVYKELTESEAEENDR